MNTSWSVAEAKARLSELLRRARDDGPQTIGRRDRFVVVTEAEWLTHQPARQPLGAWLVARAPRGTALDLPDRDDSRAIPFADDRPVAPK